MPEQRSYGDMAKDMMNMAIGGPISTLNYAARGLTGNLLFPSERLSKFRNNQGLSKDQVEDTLNRLPTKDLQMMYLRSLGMVPEEVIQRPQQLPGTDVVPIQQQTNAVR